MFLLLDDKDKSRVHDCSVLICKFFLNDHSMGKQVPVSGKVEVAVRQLKGELPVLHCQIATLHGCFDRRALLQCVGVFLHQLMISPLPEATNAFNCRTNSAS